MEPIRHPEVGELLLVPTRPDARDQPTAAQRVDRGQFLRQYDRIALRDDDHARPELELRETGADPGQDLDRVVVRPVVVGG